MADFEKEIEELVVELYTINAVKFGEFKLKSGMMSPIYFDLRVIVSFPRLMVRLCSLLTHLMKTSELQSDHICGVPYTALPIASIVSATLSIPMLIRRKEAKDYGTKKMVEGRYTAGDSCIIIEDVISSGSSILETVKDLEKEGLTVKYALVVLDREQGALNNLAEKGVQTHVLISLKKLLKILNEKSCITKEVVKSVEQFIENSQINIDGSFQSGALKLEKNSRLVKTFAERASLTKNSIARKIFRLMEDKKSLLAVAADVQTSEELLNVAKAVGPHIVILKTHIDILKDFTREGAEQLQLLAKQLNFLILEDRKFADIGNTVSLQFAQVQHWAELVTVHALTGSSIISGLKNAITGEERGGFLIAELSSAGALTGPQYAKDVIRIAEENKDFVVGIVGQSPYLLQDSSLLQLTPGVQLKSKGDNLGQQYTDPRAAVIEKGADIAVVGRGILNSDNLSLTAEEYKNQLWAAYCERVGLTF